MSSFFIRNKSKPGKSSGKKQGKKRKGLVYSNQTPNKLKKTTHSTKYDDEEISSDDEELDKNENEIVETDDEESLMTAQEKKLHLAKKYLKEIEEEEKSKLDGEEVGDELILGRLKKGILEKAGKLRVKLADSLKNEYKAEDIQVLKCKEHKLSITCIAVSEKFLFSGSKDSWIIKWSLSDFKKIGFIKPSHKEKNNENLHSSTILSLAVSHDNKYLASSDEGKNIRMWDVDTLVYLFSFTGHRAGVTGLAFDKFTKNLYSCSRDKTVKVWNVAERAYIETLFGHQGPITDIDVQSKEKAVTSGGTDKSIRLWKIQEESQLIYNACSGSTDSVRRLDDFHFITCGDDGSICLWSVSKKKPIFRINPAHGISSAEEPNWISAIGCLSNSEIFASGSCDGQVKLWQCDEGYRSVEVFTTIPVNGFVNALVFSKDNKKLFIAVGQEPKLGRWSRNKQAKNCIMVVNIAKTENG